MAAPHADRANQVQLITYPDSLGGTIKDVYRVLTTHLKGAVSGVHLLPFYPSSGDRGFAPLTHLSVDPRYGSWDDVRTIAREFDLVADLTVNHISAHSHYFKDFLAKGAGSKYASMFLDVDTFLSRNGATVDALRTTYRPRPTLPFTEFRCGDGITRKIWTTFTAEQIDLDVTQEATRRLMVRFIDRLIDNGVGMIRLDAVGYTIKKPWTNSFLIPETYEFIRWLRSVTPPEVELLAEVHHNHDKQIGLLNSGTVEWVYDFSLPLLVLHALYGRTVAQLSNWISIRPARVLSTLDTHDGIGVIDAEGLLTEDQIATTAMEVAARGAQPAYRATDVTGDNVDVYQLNSTYYSALGKDDDAYLCARAIQLFLPGIPQIYYVGLLAGENDTEALRATGHGRDINRHNYTHDELETAFRTPVVKRLLWLMRLRSTHPAFSGRFTHTTSHDHILCLKWEEDEVFLTATINLRGRTVHITYLDPHTGSVLTHTA